MDRWGAALALAFAVGAAFVVPAVHRNAEQQQAQQEQDRADEKQQMSEVLANPDVQQGLKLLREHDMSLNAVATRPATRATEPAEQ
jgi:hypothetical protein